MMEGRIVLPFALALLVLVPFASFDSDATSGLVGEGSNDTMSVSYYEPGLGLATMTFKERPSSQTIGVLILDSDLRKVYELPLPGEKVVSFELNPLSIGTYTFIITDGGTKAYITECEVLVHEPTVVTYALTFLPNGASGTMAPMMVTDGKAVLPDCSFEAPSGKSFSHWAIEGKEYHPGDTVSITKDTAASAVWQAEGSDDAMLYVIIGTVVAVIALILVILLLRRKV